MKYVAYRTQERDRWDLIAFRAYGNQYDYERIISANPTVPITAVLPPGLTLAIPVIERRDGAGAGSALPPWKREP